MIREVISLIIFAVMLAIGCSRQCQQDIMENLPSKPRKEEKADFLKTKKIPGKFIFFSERANFVEFKENGEFQFRGLKLCKNVLYGKLINDLPFSLISPPMQSDYCSFLWSYSVDGEPVILLRDDSFYRDGKIRFNLIEYSKYKHKETAEFLKNQAGRKMQRNVDLGAVYVLVLNYRSSYLNCLQKRYLVIRIPKNTDDGRQKSKGQQ